MRSLLLVVLLSIPGAGMQCAPGGTLQTVGINSAVVHYDRIAHFEGVVSGQTSSVAYTEDGLVVSTAPGVLHVSPAIPAGMIGGYFYRNTGSDSHTSIRTADGRRMVALEFNANGGGLDGLSYLYWETLRGGAVVSSGTTTILTGDFLGFARPQGIDELRIAAYFYPEDLDGRSDFTGRNRIAIDTLRVRLGPGPGS